ncbi:hypothetical protein BDP27DRAFT_1371901 [Rhodocollybia butyracea]|uniref:Uncharacterized protein n=1 Tax=Rhodocollybia butyracea TaxID=206335 RepID=A0A9P5P911_9AGAR|nr:hypothetical protein BDP27DRAFT_1371901 [Rhodocollybia butyracea]
MWRVQFAGLNTAKHNGLSSQNLIRMAQLQQYWRYGFSDPTYTHTARLELANPSTSNTIQLPAPTLHDLLNPAGPETDVKNPSFDISDPYGTKALDNEEDSDEDDTEMEQDPPLVVRAHLDHLKIESLVNLSNVKLLERYDPSSAPKVVPTEKPSTSGSRSQSNWTMKDADWSAAEVW